MMCNEVRERSSSDCLINPLQLSIISDDPRNVCLEQTKIMRPLLHFLEDKHSMDTALKDREDKEFLRCLLKKEALLPRLTS